MTNKERLKIYDTLREFQKNKLFPLMDESMDSWEMEALQTLNGVLYLIQGVFSKQK